MKQEGTSKLRKQQRLYLIENLAIDGRKQPKAHQANHCKEERYRRGSKVSTEAHYCIDKNYS